jgi:hypothetical protein
MVEEWAPTQQHNLSAGLTEGKTSFNLGLGLLDQSGMMKPAKVDKFTRYNVSLKVSSDLNKYITLRAVHFTQEEIKNTPTLPIQQQQIPGCIYTDGVHYFLLVG